jgi:NAD+ synthase
MGVSYSDLDDYLEGKDIDPEVKKTIESKHQSTEHKRKSAKEFNKK